MGAGKSSLGHTFNSHCHCGDSVTRCRPRVWIARSLLGRDRDAGSDAVNSRRDAVALIERIAATALGALVGALLASYFTGNLLVFTAAVFLL